MILSKNRELGEFDKIRTSEHIATVWGAIETGLPRYWERFKKREMAKAPAARLAGHFKAGGGKASSQVDARMRSFASAIEKYEKGAEKYRRFFHPDAMEEFHDDPNAFKQHLAKEVPVIAGTLMQRRPELQEWQRYFRASRGRDLLAVFSNLLDFREDWSRQHPETAYTHYDQLEDFGLDPAEDESMTLTNVIGMGIKSIVLYNLDPTRLPQRARSDLYGLYFLTGMNHFGLASNSSEFLMINDREPASNGSLIMEHNFWYPYGLFSLYVLRIFRWVDGQIRQKGEGLDPHARYIYVGHFLNEVCSEHADHMKVMRAHDRFEVPA
jgi:hypothetical protein